MFRHDVADAALGRSEFALDAPLVHALGDPHVENFGVLQAADGTLAIEPNDFDAADLGPYLLDVRRLGASLVLAATLANAQNESARAAAASIRREVAFDMARAYVEGLEGSLRGDAANDLSGGAIAADLLARATKDAASRDELTELTVLEGTQRTLKRGVVSPGDADELVDVPPWLSRELPALLLRLRSTLVSPPDASFFQVLDAARRYGSGVASLPRVRLLVLLRGASDAPPDDVLVELKEIFESTTGAVVPPARRFGSVANRIVESSRAAWRRPDADPLWTAGEALGFTWQMRTESEAHKNLRVARLEGALGTPEALRALARLQGGLLARVHAAPTREEVAPASRLRAHLAGREAAFAEEQASVSVLFAERALEDATRLAGIIESKGPLLGAIVEPTRVVAPLAELYGDRGP